jgi:hypothetical protein
VAAQRGDDGSLLEWTRRLLAVRRTLPEIGQRPPAVATEACDAVLVLRYGEGTLWIAHNFGTEPATLAVPDGARLIFPERRCLGGRLDLPPAASAWARVLPRG